MSSVNEQEQPPILSPNQVEDGRLAASKMRGAERRSFPAEMTLKYCAGSARIAERVFGWGRVNVEVGLAEHRSGHVQNAGASDRYCKPSELSGKFAADLFTSETLLRDLSIEGGTPQCFYSNSERNFNQSV